MPGEVWTAILVLVLAGIAFLAVRSYVKSCATGCCTGGDGPEKRLKVADNRPEHYPYQLTLSIDGHDL